MLLMQQGGSTSSIADRLGECLEDVSAFLLYEPRFH